MIPERSYVDNLFLIRSIRKTPGCIVECGVWRGGMSAGIATILGPERNYYLYDSFEGLPKAKEIDGKSALAWQADKQSPLYFNNCRAEQSFAETAMKQANCQSYTLIKGWFNTTLPSKAPNEQIAVLRLDADWYDSTMACLEALYDKVIPGGLILLDDYYTWTGCSRALHDFLSKRSAIETIRSLNDLCYILKQ